MALMCSSLDRIQGIAYVGEAEERLLEVGAAADWVVIKDRAPAGAVVEDNLHLDRLMAISGSDRKPKQGWTDVARLSLRGIPAINYGPGEVARIDFETAQYLLDLNGRDKQWEQLTDTRIKIQDVQDINAQYLREQYVDPILWKTKDGILVASYSDSTRTLEIKAYYEQQKIRQGL